MAGDDPKTRLGHSWAQGGHIQNRLNPDWHNGYQYAAQSIEQGHLDDPSFLKERVEFRVRQCDDKGDKFSCGAAAALVEYDKDYLPSHQTGDKGIQTSPGQSWMQQKHVQNELNSEWRAGFSDAASAIEQGKLENSDDRDGKMRMRYQQCKDGDTYSCGAVTAIRDFRDYVVFSSPSVFRPSGNKP